MSEPTSPLACSAYHGRWLRIDLAQPPAEARALDAGRLRRFLGGSGLGTSLLMGESSAACDAFDPETPLVLAFGPLVDSPVPGTAKAAFVCKSPLTERLNDSIISGRLALLGKRTGFDAVVVVGRATRPSIVVIDDGRVDVQPAQDLWGMSCGEVQAELGRRLGDDFATAVIGPAGERLVRYASISHEGRHAGRGGAGAVLGAKNIKAIALRGLHLCRHADPSGLEAASQALRCKASETLAARYGEQGTAANVAVLHRLGALPTRNFGGGSSDAAGAAGEAGAAGAAEAFSMERLSRGHRSARESCPGCSVGCTRRYALHTAGSARPASIRLEYESLFAFGPMCDVYDPAVVLRATQLADELGIDVISAGGTVAFAMECAARGMLDAPWLSFGSGEALLRAISEIGRREGLGNLLAEGSRRMAQQLGNDCLRFAPQVKGLEIPGYEPRAMQTLALGLAVAARGADHNRSGAYDADFSPAVDRLCPDAGAALLAVDTEDRSALLDSLLLCRFLRKSLDDTYGELSGLLNLATGWNTTPEELRQTARRIVAVKKLFNLHAGWRPEEDTLPERFFTEPLPGSPEVSLPRERFDALRTAYYAARGWSVDGEIPAAEVERLGLQAFAVAGGVKRRPS